MVFIKRYFLYKINLSEKMVNAKQLTNKIILKIGKFSIKAKTKYFHKNIKADKS